ncbi:hypothetical protein NLG97_g4090 [Lecanicillium saksenae]|uniref:Uncharacterized protein n=1 Tax=Lecanicillium saksenae TaxID=468837 RepID=A0ACC1QYV5_9HYPO|nr:hypothetical protein NLG97_g4090 [Lecanicillium saksenae]
MDIDAIRQPSLEVPGDDDLINYESDAADYTLAADQDLGDGGVSSAAPDTFATVGTTNESGDTQIADPSEDHAMDNAAGFIDATTEENAAEPPSIEHATEPELPLDADAAGAAPDALTETVADEIDYSLGEVDYGGEQDVQVGQEDHATEEGVDASEGANANAPEENVEISWEEDAAENVTTDAQQEEEDVAADQNTEQEDASHFDGLAGQASAEEEENESRDYRQDELQALEDAITGDANMGATDEFQADADDSHFPSITVQYHGDEFPFLSAGTEGFFSDLSILDDSMQNVFSGFRSQLGNDVKAEDELVFQIDELGLEFTESNTSSSLTMHQILEVFDLLIKNDDPDGSRTLYTYLFTRLNSTRRYEFLVESATSGKGLEEVQHLFPQQSSHHDSDADNGDDSAVSSEHADDHGDEEYSHEPAHEHEEHDDHHHEHHESFMEEHVEEHEQYHEEPADDHHEELGYFDEAADQEGEAFPPATDAIEDTEAAEHGDSFAHEHSSTTSTLQGDADGNALADDETAVDAEAGGPVFVAEPNEDAEIDWRDDDENDLVGDGGSVTGKRSRDDNEEPDVDDEIDFKRRRP